MTHPLDGCFEKIRWAHKHIRNLNPVVRRFEESNPCTVVRRRDPKTGKKYRSIHFTRRLTPRIALMIGDAVHNLRAALDHLACQLVIHGGGKITTRTEFPIKADLQALKRKIGEHLAGASPLVRVFVEACKPYNGGNKALWPLHRLDILDKHRRLIPTWIAAWKVTDSGPTITGQWVDLSRVLPEGIPLEEGADIDSLLPTDDTVKMRIKRGFSARITLGDVEGIKGQPVIGALEMLADEVTDIVNAASMAFFPLPSRQKRRRTRRLPK